MTEENGLPMRNGQARLVTIFPTMITCLMFFFVDGGYKFDSKILIFLQHHAKMDGLQARMMPAILCLQLVDISTLSMQKQNAKIKVMSFL